MARPGLETVEGCLERERVKILTLAKSYHGTLLFLWVSRSPFNICGQLSKNQKHSSFTVKGSCPPGAKTCRTSDMDQNLKGFIVYGVVVVLLALSMF